MDDVIKISKLEGFSITNNKDGGTFKNRAVMFIYFRSGKKIILDLIANVDITEKVENKDLILNINDDIMKQEETIFKED